MSQARIKPEVFVNFRPEPDPKSPARLTTLSVRIVIFQEITKIAQISFVIHLRRISFLTAMVAEFISQTKELSSCGFKLYQPKKKVVFALAPRHLQSNHVYNYNSIVNVPPFLYETFQLCCFILKNSCCTLLEGTLYLRI